MNKEELLTGDVTSLCSGPVQRGEFGEEDGWRPPSSGGGQEPDTPPCGSYRASQHWAHSLCR